MKNVVYTDASFSSKADQVAIGGFVSENNLMVVQFSNKVAVGKISDCNIAELYAIENGLLLARARGITKVTLFTDSKISMRYLRSFISANSDPGPRSYKLLIKDRAIFLRIFFLINSFKRIVIEHILRKFNGIANVLSKLILVIHKKNDYVNHLKFAIIFNQKLTGVNYNGL